MLQKDKLGLPSLLAALRERLRVERTQLGGFFRAVRFLLK